MVDGTVGGTRGSLTQRMMGAAMLDVATYEEVEADRTATSQAAIVVAIVAVASAIGSASGGIGAIIGGLVGAVVGWLVWSGITYLVGTRLFGGTADWGELLRTIGFAQSPGVLYILGIIPFLGGLIRLAVMIWILVAGIIAIRQALDFTTGKAVLTAIIGWIGLVVVMAVVGIVTGGAAMIGGALGG
ncbi:MAG TPA: YIP1 family protein [Longimicrobiaceae bacterium]|nr:YIP1 family protein [Longimicrobiaceae bacterium]